MHTWRCHNCCFRLFSHYFFLIREIAFFTRGNGFVRVLYFWGTISIASLDNLKKNNMYNAMLRACLLQTTIYARSYFFGLYHSYVFDSELISSSIPPNITSWLLIFLVFLIPFQAFSLNWNYFLHFSTMPFPCISEEFF